MRIDTIKTIVAKKYQIVSRIIICKWDAQNNKR